MGGIPARKPFTVHDYLSWEGGPVELIEGHVFAMAPAPSARHQTGVVNLVTELRMALRKPRSGGGNPCKAYVAPFDVVLDDFTVVQPDVCVVCDPAQIQDGRCQGAPRFVAEVLSPATASKDRNEKLRLYERHRVPEYLILDPGDGWCLRYVLGPEGLYDAGTPVPLAEPLRACGLELAATLREIAEVD